MKLLREIRVAMTPRWWMLKTRLSNGALVCGQNRSGYGGRGVYIFRDSLEPELAQLEHFLDPDSVFLDIGANTGVYTMKAAQHVGRNGIVIAVEPFPETLAMLYQNVALNGFGNVRIRGVCAAAETGAGMLWLNADKPNSFGLLNRGGNPRGISVLTVSLDDLLKWERLVRLDYLKIDVEGLEAEVLWGAQETIRRFRPLVQVEVNIQDVGLALPDYGVFQAPGSVNRLAIPKEHKKINVPATLGWTMIADSI